MNDPAIPSPPARRDYAPAARAVIWFALLLSLVAAAAHWTWHQPAMARTRFILELAGMAPPSALPVPVAGVEADRVADSFGAPRGRDRRHAGIDIFAKRGTPVTSTTRGVVTSIREGGLGGRQVWVLGPARQRHYYAHLDDWEAGLAEGDVVLPGSPLGIVGDTGNARGTPPHLHYGIYGDAGAIDPSPLLRNAR